MKKIGYFYIKAIDSIRYDIYQNNDIIYVDYKNHSYKINLPQKYQNLNEKIHITLIDMSDYENYDDYQNHVKNNIPPKYIDINNNKLKNDNIVNFIL